MKKKKNTTCSFQGNTNAIDSHLFDLLEAGQDWDLRRCRQKWSKKVPIVDRERKLKAAKSASEIDFSKFSWPSLRTHASNELHCVCCENVKTVLDAEKKLNFLREWYLSAQMRKCYMILYILALRENLLDKEHCPKPPTNPVTQRDAAENSLYFSSTSDFSHFTRN